MMFARFVSWCVRVCVSWRWGRRQGPVQVRRKAVGSRVSTHQQTDRPIPSGGTVRPFITDLDTDNHLTTSSKETVSYNSMSWAWFLQSAAATNLPHEQTDRTFRIKVLEYLKPHWYLFNAIILELASPLMIKYRFSQGYLSEGAE